MSDSCDPMDHTVHGVLQTRILEWVAFPFSRGSSQPRDWTQVSHIAGGFFTSWATRDALREVSPKVYRGFEHLYHRTETLKWGSEFKFLMRNPEMHWKVSGKLGGRPLGINKHCCSVAKSCPTVCTPLDCTAPGSSVLGDFQARIREWVAISFSRGSSKPRTESESAVSTALQAYSLPLNHQGSQIHYLQWNKAFFLRTASKL